MPPDPWGDISRTSAGGAVKARRVDAEHPYHFFWARDAEGRALLVLQYAPESGTEDPRPNLQGIEISDREELPGERAALIIALKRQEDRGIFFRLCTDIVEAARQCPTERDAVAAAIARTWKWHALLKGERDGRLGPLAQQGLVGELVVLELLLEKAGPAAALSYWRGPLEDPKDFVANGHALEVKSRQGGRPYVTISSEHQLAPQGEGDLFLGIVELSPASDATAGAFTLEGFVGRLRARISELDPARTTQFDGLLGAAGFDPRDDYGDAWWVVTDVSFCGVDENFPRIIPSMIPQATSEIRYRLDLAACEPFIIAHEQVLGRMTGETG